MRGTSPLKIAILVPGLGYGGVERGVVEQARAFCGAGDEVWVLGARGPNLSALVATGAFYLEAPLHKKDPLSIWRSIRIFQRFLEARDVDVVEAVSRLPAWVAYWVLRRRKRRPGFVTSAHGFYRPHFFSRAMTYGDRIIAVSEALKRHLVENLRADPDRVSVIYRGIDPQEFHPLPAEERARVRQRLRLNDPDFAVGMVSRLRRGKGVTVLLSACARLRRSGVPVTLVLIGAGEVEGKSARKGDRFRAQLMEQIADLKAQEWVRLVPPTPEVNPLLNALDVAVVPSTVPEAFGRGVTEAMAAGVPVVASRLGAIPEIVKDGEEALLFDAGNPDALAEALADLYSHPEKRRSLATAGLAAAGSRFLLADCLNKTRALLAETAQMRWTGA